MNVSLTAVPIAVPVFTSSSSKKILYDPFVALISPVTLTVVPTGPLFGVMVVIVVGVAVACGRSDAMIVVVSSSIVKVAVILLLSKRFPHSQTFFGACFLSLRYGCFKLYLFQFFYALCRL